MAAAGGDSAATVDPPLPDVPEWDLEELLKYERELTGFYVTAHPLARYAAAVSKFSTATTETLGEIGDGKEVKLCGIMATIKHMVTKKGDRMAYVQLEDLHGIVEVIVFPDLFRAAEPLLKPEGVLQVIGTVDRAEKGVRIKGTRIESLTDLQAKSVAKVNIRLNAEASPSPLPQLQDIFRRYPGPTSVSFTFRLAPGLEADSTPLPRYTVSTSESFVTEVEALLGKGTVALL
ncbi:MAG: OB-fold nucleic acid binding domain-containing protein, partial [Nitrospirales bacterium]